MNGKLESMNLSGKTKTLAIALTVLIGFFAWLYTYKKDYKKFWVFLGTFLFFVILNVLTAHIGELLLTSYYFSRTSHWVGEILTNFEGWTWMLYLISGSGFIWTLCNNIIRPESFYTNYPNK